MEEMEFPIVDLESLDNFLLDSEEVSNSLRDEILDDVFDNESFEFKRDEEGLGFILDFWDNEEKEGEPTQSYTYWFDDYLE